MITEDLILEVLNNYSISFKQLSKGARIEGSPERVMQRAVFESQEGSKYLINELDPNTVPRKEIIATTLDLLKNMPKVLAHTKNNENKSITEVNNRFFEISEYLDSEKLPRPEYVKDAWRGKQLANFLIDLSNNSKNIEKTEAFYFSDFIKDLQIKLQQHNPEILKQIIDIIKFLENKFFQEEKDIPLTFSHGDYHPLNMLWKDDQLLAVIDWEFCGSKPELYDMANLLGCIGQEHPEYLIQKLSIAFIKTMKESNLFSSWDQALNYIIAMRFAWLSEWLRKDRPDMQQLEIDYMHVLIKNYKEINKIFILKLEESR